jgi:hypothetical protein
MRLYWILALLFVASVSINAQALPANDEKEIKYILENQRQCWNQGDINCFMIGYWESEALRFLGKNGVTKGFEATKARYFKSYPDKEAMGHLTFTILSLEKLSRKKALVIGKWELDRKEDKLEGHFSLIWKKIKGSWVIVLDHSS